MHLAWWILRFEGALGCIIGRRIIGPISHPFFVKFAFDWGVKIPWKNNYKFYPKINILATSEKDNLPTSMVQGL